jgi:lysophospholipase L1-like esterase
VIALTCGLVFAVRPGARCWSLALWILLIGAPLVAASVAEPVPPDRAGKWLIALIPLAVGVWYVFASTTRNATIFQLSFIALVIGSLAVIELGIRISPRLDGFSRGDLAFGLHRAEYQFRETERDSVWASYSRRYHAFAPTFEEDYLPPEVIAAEPTLRVVTMGGSSTVGVGASDLRYSYPSWLQAALLRRGVERPKVINAAINGYTSFDNRLLTHRDLAFLDPDVVILNLSANDGFTAWWLPKDQQATYEDFRAIWDARQPLPLALARTRILGYALRRLDTLKRPWRTDLGAPVVPLEKFDANVRDIITSCRGLGASVVMVAEPYFESERPGEFSYEPYHAAMRQIGAELGVPVLEPAFTRGWNRMDKVFSDGVHLTDEGYRRMAEVVADGIMDVIEGGRRAATAGEAASHGGDREHDASTAE